MELFSIKDQLTPEQATPEFLGGKGYGLYWMQTQGVNVPPALIIPTTACVEYMQKPKTVMKEIAAALPKIMEYFKNELGHIPLLSVRSGARVSMPGMMDTILNVGLDSKTEKVWRKKLGDACYTDSLHRLITMYGSVVKGLDRQELEKDDLISAHKYYERKTSEDFPDTKAQLLNSIEAVFKSWNNDRAKFYRKMHNIPEAWGTAVVIQAMVFGNLNDKSGTGVLFTRNPDTGENKVTGEFLVNAQGEDVVAGIRTPIPLYEIGPMLGMELGAELLEAVEKLEQARKDVQDVEFTIQDGKLFILQTRNAKRSANAAIRIALDMVAEGMIDAKTAMKKVSAREFDIAQQSVIDPKYKEDHHYKGIPACSGVVTGVVVRSAEAAINCKQPCILVTAETTPDDIAGMDAAVGVLTMTGGATSHAAVVARGMNKPCVVGLGFPTTAQEDQGLPAFGELFPDGLVISLDGATGRVWRHAVPVVDGKNSPAIMEWRKLVIDTMGVIPVVDSPSPGMTDVLIDVGGILHELALCVTRVQTALKTVSGTVFVDCRASGRTPAEVSFNRIFQNGIDHEAAFVAALEHEVQVKDELRVVLITDKPTPMKTMGTASDLRSLILSKGLLAIDPGQTLDIKDPAVAKVLSWLSVEGLEFMHLGHYVEGKKSAVSPEQAMQLMQ